MLEYLAIWPILHFLAILKASRLNNRLKILFNIYAIMYLDWLFVPFNYLIAYSVNFSWILFMIFFILSLIATLFLHKKWQKSKSRSANFFIDKNGMTPEGWIHFIFMAVQASLVATVILSTATSFYYFYMMLCLLTYLVGFLLIVKFVRKVKLNAKAEMPFLLLGLIVVLIRMLLFFIM